MNKKDIDTLSGARQSFSGHNTYSIAEILAAGGATAFASKLGKDPKNIGERLKHLAKETFLTGEEAADALKVLNESK